MQHEWSIKYPTRRRPRPREYNGVMGRLESLSHVFRHMEKVGCEKVVCHVREEHLDFMKRMSEPFASFLSVCLMDVSELQATTMRRVANNRVKRIEEREDDSRT